MDSYKFASLSDVQKVNFLNERTILINQLGVYYRSIKDKNLRKKAADKYNKKIEASLEKYFDICNEVIISFNNTIVNVLNNELITIEKLREKTTEEIPEELNEKLNELNINIKKDFLNALGLKEGTELKIITEVNLKPENYHKIYKLISDKIIQNIYNDYLLNIKNLME